MSGQENYSSICEGMPIWSIMNVVFYNLGEEYSFEKLEVE